MSVTVSSVFLRDGKTGALVAADLYDSILPKHLEDHEKYWKPSLYRRINTAIGTGDRSWRTTLRNSATSLLRLNVPVELKG